ncbi:MAG: DUF962 domain-containing protein [Bacteroidetes bacterium]|nr:DUF962 domain-containing protein [Bacteroidota bacterium]
MIKKFNSLQEFYPFYLTEHSNTICRSLHFVGTSIVIGLLISAIITQKWWLLLLMPLAGYGFAWVGHFVFEKNKPAAFKQPLYSLASDFLMFYHIITFQIQEKLTEAKSIYGTN